LNSPAIRRSLGITLFFARTIALYSVLKIFQAHTIRNILLEKEAEFRTKNLSLFYIRLHVNLQIRLRVPSGMIAHQFNGEIDE
jgi:hypothetical protein